MDILLDAKYNFPNAQNNFRFTTTFILATIMSSLAASNDDSLPGDMVDFLNASWTCFHAIQESVRRLKLVGYQEIFERDGWRNKLEAGGKYFFTRNDSSIIAFAVGKKYKAGNGIISIGAHSDSPCLKLKPRSKVTSCGYQQLGVQTYGGGLWNTWFDRDLGIAGRVVIKEDGGKSIKVKLVQINKPVCRIPTLAVHLARGTGTKLEINCETSLPPVIASTLKAQLSETDEAGNSHHTVLLGLIAEELGVETGQIEDFELQLCEVQPSTIGGAKSEFIFSGRLDNLCSSYCGLRALIDTTSSEGALDEEESIRLLAVFDHEEIGSTSTSGARGSLMMDSIKRIAKAFSDPAGLGDVVEQSTQRSFIISADMAHGIHPNYAGKHEKNHAPAFHEGVVIKTNANQRYATNAITSYMFKEFARRGNGKIQEFVIRQDMGCGSTIGSILAAGCGIRTVDVGCPQWSMHSAREVMGTDDVIHAVRIFRAAYTKFTDVDRLMQQR